MNQLKNLTKPPVKEAIIDLSFRTEGEINLPSLRVLAKKLEELSYRDPIKYYARYLNEDQNDEHIGYVVHHKDGAQTIKVSFQGITYDYLIEKGKKYPGGDKVFSYFEKIWLVCEDTFYKYPLDTLVLRNINQIVSETKKMAKHFKVLPAFPEIENRDILAGEAFQRLSIADRDLVNRANVSYLWRPKDSSFMRTILDTEIYQHVNEPVDWPIIHKKLISMRDFKNDVFESSLTKNGIRELCS